MGANVFEVDATKAGAEPLCGLNHLVDVLRVHLDAEAVHVGETLNKTDLPSITGFAASAPILPRPKRLCQI